MFTVGSDKFVGNPDSPAEIDAPGELAEHAVGTRFNPEPIDRLGCKGPPESVAGLEDRDVYARIKLRQPVCSRESADSSTNHGDA
jgi:hypothetical protein